MSADIQQQQQSVLLQRPVFKMNPAADFWQQQRQQYQQQQQQQQQQLQQHQQQQQQAVSSPSPQPAQQSSVQQQPTPPQNGMQLNHDGSVVSGADQQQVPTASAIGTQSDNVSVTDDEAITMVAQQVQRQHQQLQDQNNVEMTDELDVKPSAAATAAAVAAAVRSAVDPTGAVSVGGQPGVGGDVQSVAAAAAAAAAALGQNNQLVMSDPKMMTEKLVSELQDRHPVVV